jgi:hypothetical protein
MRDLDLPRGDERELVLDGDRVYELDGEDIMAFAERSGWPNRETREGRGCPSET